jgi:hypothetical protein
MLRATAGPAMQCEPLAEAGSVIPPWFAGLQIRRQRGARVGVTRRVVPILAPPSRPGLS